MFWYPILPISTLYYIILSHSVVMTHGGDKHSRHVALLHWQQHSSQCLGFLAAHCSHWMICTKNLQHLNQDLQYWQCCLETVQLWPGGECVQWPMCLSSTQALATSVICSLQLQSTVSWKYRVDQWLRYWDWLKTSTLKRTIEAYTFYKIRDYGHPVH